MDDPYKILGVRRGDGEEAIRNAYRKLAKRHHPDLNPGKPEAAERFKAINAAHDLLSDPERRARFDRGEIDAEGNETAAARGFRARPAQAEEFAGGFGAGGGASAEELEALFGSAFGQRAGGFGGGFGGFRGGGRDVHYALTVDFIDAALGAVRRLTLPDGRTLDVTIPAGLRDGHVLRLRGQGEPGLGADVAAGDALVEINVAPHPLFRREGDDVLMDLPVTLQEAVLGAAIDVPTIKGRVRVTLPPNSANGRKLRLKGRGINGGNQVVEVRVVLPATAEPALADFLRGWTPEHPLNPREGMTEGAAP